MTKYNSIYKFIEDYEEKHPESPFFSKNSLKAFGEQLSGMRILRSTEIITDYKDIKHECYVLSRIQHKHPCGAKRKYSFFEKETLDIILPKIQR